MAPPVFKTDSVIMTGYGRPGQVVNSRIFFVQGYGA